MSQASGLIKNNNFWQELVRRQEKILALAPMAGFTNSAFRQLAISYGANVTYSEMASAAAIYYQQRDIENNLNNKTLELLEFNPQQEKYYVTQIFGSEPEHFAQAAKIISQEIQPDGLDINFGCPVGKVIKQGAGATLMKDLGRSRAIIQAVLANTSLPVSLKMRRQVGSVSYLDLLKKISDLPIAALMIHGRTLDQGFTGERDFSSLSVARQYFSAPIILNGGINDLLEAEKILKIKGADGLALARGALARPWLFQEIKEGRIIDLPLKDIFQIMLKLSLAAEKRGGRLALKELRKHLVYLIHGRNLATKIRSELVQVTSSQDLQMIIKKYS